jgi:hypothetical protein
MEGITIHAGDIAATCETPEQAAALVRALQSGPSEAPAKRRPRIEATDEAGPRRRRKVAANGEAPDGASKHGAIKRAILAVLTKDPSTDVRTIALKVYGSDETAKRNRVHSTLHTMVKRGDIKKLSTGGYRVL